MQTVEMKELCSVDHQGFVNYPQFRRPVLALKGIGVNPVLVVRPVKLFAFLWIFVAPEFQILYVQPRLAQINAQLGMRLTLSEPSVTVVQSVQI